MPTAPTLPPLAPPLLGLRHAPCGGEEVHPLTAGRPIDGHRAIAGHRAIPSDGSAPVAVGAGDALVRETAFAGPWGIHETARKPFCLRRG